MAPKKETYLALEFTEYSVKFAKIAVTESMAQLLDVQMMQVPRDLDVPGRQQFYRQAAEKILSREDKKSPLVLSINSLHTCFASFVLPKINHKEIAETLKWKIKDEIPFPIEEAALDYHASEFVSENKPQLLALVAATPEEAVREISERVHEDTLRPCFYPPVCFSIDRLIPSLALPPDELLMIIDIGYSITEITIYSAGKLTFLRKIAFGGQILLQAMTQPLTSERGHMRLEPEEAEAAIKKENLFDQSDPTLLANKIELSKIYPLIRPEFEKLASEISRSLDYFMQQHGKGVFKIYLTGGLSRLKGLPDFLQQTIQTPVSVLDLSQALVVSKSVSHELNPFYHLIALTLERASSAGKTNLSLDRPIYSMNLKKAMLLLISVWMIVLGSLIFRSYETSQKQKLLTAEVENLQLGYQHATQIEELQNLKRKGQAVIGHIFTGVPNWNEAFRELSNVFPDDVIVTDISFDQKAILMNGAIKKGDEKVVSEILHALDGPIFTQVTLVNIEKTETETQFRIKAEVR